ncbi:hypothetical protein HY969_05060 [Candidatus Kaiserbacteria bacterium]|nr:hypothetical protein [Candidatus Kaiserbacteria bacterium]
MVVGAVTVFFASLAGIAALFSVKLLEEKRARTYGSGFWAIADTLALKCKALLISIESALSRMPSLTMYASVRLLAFAAAGLARLMHGAAEAAHRLADLVSHKHNFERRETRSDFLKQVSEYPRTNGANVPPVSDNVPAAVQPEVALRKKKSRKKLM